MIVGSLGRAGELQQLGAARPLGRHRWLALLALPLLAIPLLLLAWWWFSPGRLDETTLVGARGPSCLRVVLAADVSGSMAHLAGPRDRAVDELLSWAQFNLRADDELALISFAGDASLDIPPTRIGDKAARSGSTVGDGGTRLAPVLSAVESLVSSRCRTALLLMGDGQFEDLPSDERTGREQLAAAGVDTFLFLVPGATDTPAQWGEQYPYAPPVSFDGSNPDATAMAFGRQLAILTGQHLQRLPPGTEPTENR